MSYYLVEFLSSNGEMQQHIIQPLVGGGMRSFPATDDNPNMVDYLAWVAEGNTAEQWQPTQPESEN